MRFPTETYTGETPSLVLRTLPTTSPRCTRSVTLPFSLPGSSWLPTSRLLAHPTVGTSRKIPRCEARPIRRSCARPWHGREPERCLEALHFDEGERRELEHHDRGIGPVSCRGHVRASHITHAIEVEGRPGHHPGGQLLLQTPGLGRGEIKPMKPLDFHSAYINKYVRQDESFRYTTPRYPQKRPSRPMESGG